MTPDNKIYTFPNGYSIRFALSFDTKTSKGNRFKRASIDNKPFEKAINSKIKLRLPLLDLDTSYDFPIVAADFDHLPDDFMDWDHFEQYLTQTYSDKGLVIRTPSGKCKVLFQLKMPTGVKLVLLDRLATLKALLLPEDFPWIDDLPTALSKVYLTKEMLSKLQNWKPQFFIPIIKKTPKPLTFSELEAKYTFENLMQAHDRFTTEELTCVITVEELLSKHFKRMKPTTIKYIAIYLVRYRKGLCAGFHLNQKLMATMVNLSQPSVSAFLTKASKLGWLEADVKYCPNVFAKRHTAKGALKEAFGYLTPKKEDIKNLLHQPVPCGEANKYYLKVNRMLAAAGYSKDQALNALLDLDKTRPTPKQRPSSYFRQLVNSWNKS